MIARDVELIEASDPFQQWQAANGHAVTDEGGAVLTGPTNPNRWDEDARRAE